MTDPSAPVIAIDGPSGSGKGVVSRRVARRLGWHLLDSGALYRLVALAGLRGGLGPADERGHAALAGALDAHFAADEHGDERILLDGQDVTRDLRTETAGEAASRVAAMQAVRSALLQRQRDYVRPPGLVADGRDMGTVVFTTAALKVFLTASPEVRAARRHKQLKEKGIDVSLADLSRDIRQRDERDANRSVAPLRPAGDAVVIDSTALSIDEVVARVVELGYEKIPAIRLRTHS